jgi:hypothetical protein
MAQTHHIYLIPGFFGFVNFGELIYFTHVREYLQKALETRGMRTVVHRLKAPPTASLRRRATVLCDAIREHDTEGEPIHLIGHSTGGLDARLFVTPSANLGIEGHNQLASHVLSVLTIATPHYGTPLASLFSSMLGQHWLKLLSVATVFILREGRIPAAVLARFGAAVARLRVQSGPSVKIFDHLCDELIEKLPAGERGELHDFFTDVGKDQALLPQLAPEAMDLFNIMAGDRPGVRYGSVVTRAQPPVLGHRWSLGFRMTDQVTYSLYSFLAGRVADFDEAFWPALPPDRADALRRAYGGMPRAGDGDGIVPTWSQIWGEVVHAASADHLDVIGHFDDRAHRPPHHDWIVSGSEFTREDFDRLWSDAADFIAGA